MTEAIRNARHFLPSNALPPYPEPKDQISRVSGKCTIHLSLSLHGQATSFLPGVSGEPTECTQGTNGRSSPSQSATARPMRVMMRMLTATYAESEISTPTCAIGDPIGPMENGITYIVRPR